VVLVMNVYTDPWLTAANKAIMDARDGREPPMPVRTFEWPVDGTRRQQSECGVEAGYAAHLRRNEPPCPDCRAARSKARKQRRKDAAA
jgi:hypothetical protein